MDIFIARQPIFDRQLKVYGYELLYRRDGQNCFSGLDDDLATAELIYNSFLVFGLNDLTDDTRAFINFSKALADSEMPYMLPPSSVVIEVLERDQATQSTINACKKLRSKGYKIALDDFTFDKQNLPLIEFVDIVKVEYPALSVDAQARLIRQYGTRIKFLAEKIETREDYSIALDLGYTFFQGYFFSKPAMMGTKEIESLNTNIFRIMEELNNPDPSFSVIIEILEGDLGLSYKLLKLINSAYYGSKRRIKTVSYALTYLGTSELYQWLSLMMIKDIQNVENVEMIKISLIRGKLMELAAVEIHETLSRTECFLTGMFSFVDILLNKTMAQVLKNLPFSDNVKEALLGNNNEYRELLNCVIASELGDGSNLDVQYPANKIGKKRFMELYLKALKWAKKLNY